MKPVSFLLIALTTASLARGAVVDFEDLSLAPNSHFDGPTSNAVVVDGPWGPELHGTFESGNVQFINRYDPGMNMWSGFAYSNENDTTSPDFANQFSAYTTQPNGNNQFAVGFGYLDTKANLVQEFDFDPSNPAHLAKLPYMQLPAGYTITSMQVTPITYTALTVLNGNFFSTKFGGVSGNNPDWLLLTAYGTDSEGQPLPNYVEFYLADYRFEDNSLDYVISDWTVVDLTPLSAASVLYFNVTSSDVGVYGMNTPAYYAIDNIQLVSVHVPEPSTLATLITGAVLLFTLARHRRRA